MNGTLFILFFIYIYFIEKDRKFKNPKFICKKKKLTV